MPVRAVEEVRELLSVPGSRCVVPAVVRSTKCTSTRHPSARDTTTRVGRSSLVIVKPSAQRRRPPHRRSSDRTTKSRSSCERVWRPTSASTPQPPSTTASGTASSTARTSRASNMDATISARGRRRQRIRAALRYAERARHLGRRVASRQPAGKRLADGHEHLVVRRAAVGFRRALDRPARARPAALSRKPTPARRPACRARLLRAASSARGPWRRAGRHRARPRGRPACAPSDGAPRTGRSCGSRRPAPPAARVRPLPFRGRKPSNTKRPVGRPLVTNAAIAADGPGTTSTEKPCAVTARTRRSPGSEMPGVPASVTTATLSPARSRARTSPMRLGLGVIVDDQERRLPRDTGPLEQLAGLAAVLAADRVRRDAALRPRAATDRPCCRSASRRERDAATQLAHALTSS